MVEGERKEGWWKGRERRGGDGGKGEKGGKKGGRDGKGGGK